MGCSLPAVVDRACRRRHIATVTCLADRHLSGADPVLRLKSVPKARDLGPCPGHVAVLKAIGLLTIHVPDDATRLPLHPVGVKA